MVWFLGLMSKKYLLDVCRDSMWTISFERRDFRPSRSPKIVRSVVKTQNQKQEYSFFKQFLKQYWFDYVQLKGIPLKTYFVSFNILLISTLFILADFNFSPHIKTLFLHGFVITFLLEWRCTQLHIIDIKIHFIKASLCVRARIW